MKNTALLFILIVWCGHASSNSMTIYCERLKERRLGRTRVTVSR